MVIKTGRFGDFLSCTGYPTCKNARPVPLGVACPKCGGDIIEIRPRKKGGRTFFGCSNFNAEQKCDFKLWMRPVPEPCPKCSAPFLTRSGGKKPMLICATKECGYKRELPEVDADGVEVSSSPVEGDEVAGTDDGGKAALPEAALAAPVSEAGSSANGAKKASKPAAAPRSKGGAAGPRSSKSPAG
jgi:DNA topoisomerase-1